MRTGIRIMAGGISLDDTIKQLYAAPESSLREKLPGSNIPQADIRKRIGIRNWGMEGAGFMILGTGYAIFEKVAEDYHIAGRLMDYLNSLF